jgi:hypothetical protein
VGGIGRNAGWGAGDEEGTPFKGRGVEPIRYLDDVPDDLWRHKLLWFLYPSLLVALAVWWGLNQWLHLPDWTGWISVVIAMAIYVVIGLRGPQLVAFGSRVLGRQSNLR